MIMFFKDTLRFKVGLDDAGKWENLKHVWHV